jgi:hypothetical protein
LINSEKTGRRLNKVRTALEVLAQVYPPQELERRAYAFYQQNRPEIPEEKIGWGAAGDLNLEHIRKRAKIE